MGKYADLGYHLTATLTRTEPYWFQNDWDWDWYFEAYLEWDDLDKNWHWKYLTRKYCYGWWWWIDIPEDYSLWQAKRIIDTFMEGVRQMLNHLLPILPEPKEEL